jgi:hypothetical protein
MVHTTDETDRGQAIVILCIAGSEVDRAARVFEQIEDSLKSSEHRNKFRIQKQLAVKSTGLDDILLEWHPHIVHYSGRVTPQGEIILVGDQGKEHPVSPGVLARLLGVLRDNIRCMVLTVCLPPEYAQAIAENIDCVVGMSQAIRDETAVNFATSFYQALGYGRTIQEAFDLGSIAIETYGAGSSEQAAPRLTPRTGIDPAQITLSERKTTAVDKSLTVLSNLTKAIQDDISEACDHIAEIIRLGSLIKHWQEMRDLLEGLKANLVRAADEAADRGRQREIDRLLALVQQIHALVNSMPFRLASKSRCIKKLNQIEAEFGSIEVASGEPLSIALNKVLNDQSDSDWSASRALDMYTCLFFAIDNLELVAIARKMRTAAGESREEHDEEARDLLVQNEEELSILHDRLKTRMRELQAILDIFDILTVADNVLEPLKKKGTTLDKRDALEDLRTDCLTNLDRVFAQYGTLDSSRALISPYHSDLKTTLDDSEPEWKDVIDQFERYLKQAAQWRNWKSEDLISECGRLRDIQQSFLLGLKENT